MKQCSRCGSLVEGGTIYYPHPIRTDIPSELATGLCNVCAESCMRNRWVDARLEREKFYRRGDDHADQDASPAPGS